MDSLLNPTIYPPLVREKILSLPPLAVEIANRWFLGWPRTVKELIQQDEYLPALLEQFKTEANVLAQAADLQHLARHEIQELFDVSPAPPTPTTSQRSG